MTAPFLKYIMARYHMDRKYPVRIGELIDKHIKNSEPFTNAMKEDTVMSNWGRVVGENIASCTTKLYMRNNKLYVGFSSPIARTEFMQIRKQALYKLNQIAGERYVKLIVVI